MIRSIEKKSKRETAKENVFQQILHKPTSNREIFQGLEFYCVFTFVKYICITFVLKQEKTGNEKINNPQQHEI